MAVTKAIELLKVLQQEVRNYHTDYDQFMHNFLEDEQRKKPIDEFLRDLRVETTPKKEVVLENKESLRLRPEM